MCNNNQGVLKILDLSPQKVLKVPIRLNPNKTPGVDQIYSVMFKNLANVLAIPLSHIFKCSMATGIVPGDWRIANVTVKVAIHLQHGNRNSPWRPEDCQCNSKGGYPLASFLAQVQCLTVSVAWTPL